jgi:hypothetical protein
VAEREPRPGGSEPLTGLRLVASLVWLGATVALYLAVRELGLALVP